MAKLPALIPGLTPERNRHKRPWRDSSRTSYVPLLDEQGVDLEGRIVVPVSYLQAVAGDFITPPPHTNERLKFEKFILENLERWAEWRKRRGWEMVSRPKVRGPILPLGGAKPEHTARAKQVLGEGRQVHQVIEETDEVRWYMARATFKRSTPSFIKLEDHLYLNHLNDIYSQPEPKDSGWVNPLEYAEQRRQRLGLKREDYLFGPLDKPL